MTFKRFLKEFPSPIPPELTLEERKKNVAHLTELQRIDIIEKQLNEDWHGLSLKYSVSEDALEEHAKILLNMWFPGDKIRIDSVTEKNGLVHIVVTRTAPAHIESIRLSLDISE